MRRNGILAILVAGHFITDGYMGMVAPLLPIIRERLGLSMALMGLIPFLTSVTASLAQPLFGWLCDRTRGAYFAGFGVAATAVGIATFGMAKSFPMMLLLLGLGGLGCGSFHPAGAALAARARQDRRDLALAIFSPGGITGYSVGPIVAIWLYGLWGLDRMWPVMILGLVAGPIIGIAAARLEAGQTTEDKQQAPPVDQDGVALPRRRRLTALGTLLVVVFLRSAVVIVFIAFLAQLMENRGVPERLWGYAIGAFTFAGGAAGLVGGYIAQAVGRRRLTVISLALCGPALFFFVNGPSPVVSWVCLIIGGALAQAAVPVNIVQAQMLLPTRQSLASALTMGFCWGTAAAVAPGLGYLVDHYTTLEVGLSVACVLPLIAAGLALLVPELTTGKGPVGPEPPIIPPPPIQASGGE